MNSDYLWKIRCSESGDLVGDCGCIYCFDEFDLSESDDWANLDDDWSDDEDLEGWEEWEDFTDGDE